MSNTIPSDDEPILIKAKLTRRGCAWRLGCIAIWLPLMLLPIFLLALAVQGEVALWHNAAFPAGAEHPFLQAKLLMEIETRGLNLTRSYISTSSDEGRAVCVQTHVRFVLWQGVSTPADYCDCYARESADSSWALTSTQAGQCG